MTPNNYIIDSSSLIELHRHNPMDVYPTVWKNLTSLIKSGLLMAPKEVLYEITQRDDQLAEWAKEQTGLFREPTNRQIEIATDMLREYPALVNESRKYDADV